MTNVITPRQHYMEVVSQYPLSETITEVEALFNGGLMLSSKSGEQRLFGYDRQDYVKGDVLGYTDEINQKLFVYLGLVFFDSNFRVYPSGFFFGTDLEDSKMEDFLNKIKGRDIPYECRKNVIDRHNDKSPLMTCVESHKSTKKGMYEEIKILPFCSSINVLKQILDR